MSVFRPTLAATVVDLSTLRYPLLATPKIDGVRCFIMAVDGRLEHRIAVSRNLKSIPNHNIRTLLNRLPIGFDGEIVCPGGFNSTQSAVMSYNGNPPFMFHAFDLYSSTAPYYERVANLIRWCKMCPCPWVSPLVPDQLDNEQELLDYEAIALEKGYEGVMLRHPEGPYKHGRSTLKEHYLLKLKRFLDSEAVIEDFEEKVTNENEQTTDALGLSKRSSHAHNLVGADTLGSLFVKDLTTGQRFSIGSGFDDLLRTKIWANRSSYLGQTITYKYQPHGMKDAPRFPVFKCFKEDL